MIKNKCIGVTGKVDDIVDFIRGEYLPNETISVIIDNDKGVNDGIRL